MYSGEICKWALRHRCPALAYLRLKGLETVITRSISYFLLGKNGGEPSGLELMLLLIPFPTFSFLHIIFCLFVLFEMGVLLCRLASNSRSTNLSIASAGIKCVPVPRLQAPFSSSSSLCLLLSISWNWLCVGAVDTGFKLFLTPNCTWWNQWSSFELL